MIQLTIRGETMDNNTKVSQNELAILRQYQSMVDETNIVSKTDPKGIITYVNSKFIQISGYSKDELIGKAHNIVRDPDSPASIYKELWESISAKNIWHGVVTNIRKDGTKYTVNASIFPILDSSGEIIEYISIRHDITKLLELTNKLEEINRYSANQQYLAKEKLEAGIVNELNDDEHALVHIPSDILSGDFYSIYKMDDGSIFLYLIDGQGHGISPALTVFAISSMLNTFIHNITNINDLIQKLSPQAKTFLGELEQLSYIMLMISPDKESITYASGGMYPILIKTKDKVLKIKANNTPFMNFSPTPVCTKIDVGKWDALIVYSDGIIEHQNNELKKYAPQQIIKEPSTIKDALDKLSKHNFEDDATVISIF